MTSTDDLDVEAFRREAGEHTVTGILRRAGLVRFYVSPARLSELAEEGKQVHFVVADIAQGDTTEYWRDIAWLAPYADAFSSWQRQYQFRCEFSEYRIQHPVGYRGTLDLAGVMHSDSKKHRRNVVVEVKRAVRAKAYRLQVAAYQNALGEEIRAYKNAARICLYLRPDATYIADPHDGPFDFGDFLHAFGVARLREAWGLVNKDDERRFDDIIRGEYKTERGEFEDVEL